MPCGFATLLENLIALYLKCSQFHKVNDSKMGCLLKVNVSGVPAPNLHSQAMSGLGSWLFRPGLCIKTKGSLWAKKEPSVWKKGEEPRNQQGCVCLRWVCCSESRDLTAAGGEGRPKAYLPY